MFTLGRKEVEAAGPQLLRTTHQSWWGGEEEEEAKGTNDKVDVGSVEDLRVLGKHNQLSLPNLREVSRRHNQEISIQECSHRESIDLFHICWSASQSLTHTLHKHSLLRPRSSKPFASVPKLITFPTSRHLRLLGLSYHILIWGDRAKRLRTQKWMPRHRAHAC